MTTTEPSQTGQPVPPAAPRRSRLRSILVGGALILSGVIIGIGTTAISQDGPRWRDGWHDRDMPRHGRMWDRGDRDERGGRYDRDDDRGRYDRDDDRGYRDGPRGWFHRWRHGDHHGRDGMRMGAFGGPMMLTPGRIDRMVDRLSRVVDASRDQEQRLRDILRGVADDLGPLRNEHMRARREVIDILTAQTIDRQRLDTLRADHVGLMDRASKRVVSALADAAEVLTPAQRSELGRRITERQRRFER